MARTLTAVVSLTFATIASAQPSQPLDPEAEKVAVIQEVLTKHFGKWEKIRGDKEAAAKLAASLSDVAPSLWINKTGSVGAVPRVRIDRILDKTSLIVRYTQQLDVLVSGVDTSDLADGFALNLAGLFEVRSPKKVGSRVMVEIAPISVSVKEIDAIYMRNFADQLPATGDISEEIRSKAVALWRAKFDTDMTAIKERAERARKAAATPGTEASGKRSLTEATNEIESRMKSPLAYSIETITEKSKPGEVGKMKAYTVWVVASRDVGTVVDVVEYDGPRFLVCPAITNAKPGQKTTIAPGLYCVTGESRVDQKKMPVVHSITVKKEEFPTK